MAAVAQLTYEVSHRDKCLLTVTRVGVNDESIAVVQCSVCVCARAWVRPYGYMDSE